MGKGFKFIDLYHSDDVKDLAEVKDAGIAGVFLKGSDGTQVWADWFNETSLKAKEEGLLVGAYHWLQPGPLATDQVAAFLSLDLSLVDPELGLCVDFEPTPSAANDRWLHSATSPAKKLSAFLENLKDAGKSDVVVYSGGVFQDYMDRSPESSRLELAQAAADIGVRTWISRYPFNDDRDFDEAEFAPYLPPELTIDGNPIGPLWAWQYTEKDSVPGIGGECDSSVVL